MNKDFLESLDRKTLLLPHFPELLFEKSAEGYRAVQIPEWLFRVLGIEKENSDGGLAIAVLNERIPGLFELVDDVARNKNSVQGFQATLKDGDGIVQPVLVGAIFQKNEEGAERIAVNIQNVQQFPSKEHLERQKTTFFGLIGKSQAMLRVFNKIRLYGTVDSPVLILGETGTGKEGVALALHQVSKRKNGSYIPVNCNAISENLFESELFGHERGSFTGAVQAHKGRFERADRGTLFLDEIGDMPASLQAKLLRVLETSIFERVGGERPIKVDVRVVAATNRNLEEDSMKQTFRPDLFYRLNALQIIIPPLRDRAEDIPLLVNHFVDLFNEKFNRRVICLSPEAIHLLKQYRWPGNVRELRNLMERLFAENQGEVIGLRALREWYEERVQAAKHLKFDSEATILPYKSVIPLGMESPNKKDSREFEPASVPISKENSKVELTEESVRQAFRQAKGNMTRAASILGIHKATLYRFLKTSKLSREDLESA